MLPIITIATYIATFFDNLNRTLNTMANRLVYSYDPDWAAENIEKWSDNTIKPKFSKLSWRRLDIYKLAEIYYQPMIVECAHGIKWPFQEPALNKIQHAWVVNGDFIKAIKSLRDENMDLGLGGAKDIVVRYARANGIPCPYSLRSELAEREGFQRAPGT